jgi:hypothetical protein
MKRAVRIVLAIIIIFLLYGIWIMVGEILFGWKHGGGAIPTMLFFGLAAFIWRTITKKTSKEKGEDSHNTDGTITKIEDTEK